MRAVIFDLGGVVFTSPFLAFARYERNNGLPDGFLRRLNALAELERVVGFPLR